MTGIGFDRCEKCNTKIIRDWHHDYIGNICEQCYEEEIKEKKELDREYKRDKF